MPAIIETPVRHLRALNWRIRRFLNHPRTQQVRSGGSVVLATGICVAVLVTLGAIPVRNYVGQREALAEAEAELARIRGDVDAARLELRQLETDEEIERRARANFDLVFPGEESYRILPAPGGAEGGASEIQPTGGG